jgi:hypothetical protein
MVSGETPLSKDARVVWFPERPGLEFPMSLRSQCLWIGLAAAIFPILPSHAQDPRKAVPAPREEAPRREITVWGGGSFGNPDFIGSYTGDRFLLGGVRFGQRFWNGPKMSLSGNLGLIPVAVLSQPTAGGREHIYGGGATTGGELAARNSWWAQPYGEAGVGFLMFTRAVPYPNARRFNFSVYFGPGVKLPRQRLRIGLWYFHFSNARTAPNNTGVDGFVLYMGYSFPRK